VLGIIEPRYSRNNRPQFQAEFHVPEEEPDGPWVGLPDARRAHPHHHQYPPPVPSRWGVPPKQEKPPQTRGLLSSLAPGKKSALSLSGASGDGPDLQHNHGL